jgi:type IV pilus assembly protein PilO
MTFTLKTRKTLNLHLAGALLLVVVNIYLIVQIAISITTMHSNSGEAIINQDLQLQQARVDATPLRGLDKKLDIATTDAIAFEKSRMPAEQSAMVAELGALAQKANVHLSHVQYAPLPATAGLTEYSMDASLTGDYRPLVLFINSVERDKIFFLIGNVTLSGQQGGVVTLKIRLSSWLRPEALRNDTTEKSSSTKSDTEAAR